MPSLDNIVNVNISLVSNPVALPSFAIPLIVGPTNASWSDYVHTYLSPSGMLTDGFTTSSPEYIYALEMFEQPVTPTQFMVGHRTAAAAQVDDITVNTVTSGHVYSFTLNGTVITYTALSTDSYHEIVTGLNASLVAASLPSTGVVSGSGSSSKLEITANVAGAPNSYTAVNSLLTLANVTPNNGIQNDLLNIIAENNGWYGMCGCAFTDNDILQGAALIETLKKIYLAISDTSAIPTSSSTDVASVLKAKNYKRTALLYTNASYIAEGKDAAWLGGQLPRTPGSNNWAFAALQGCTPDVLSDNAQAILIGNPVAGTKGKNVNIYQTVAGAPITEMGTMAGGQYIDITIGLDWLQSTIQTNLFTALVTAAKIPFTDKGTGILLSAVKAAIDLGAFNGLIDPASPISITAPSVLSVPASQRANRIAPTISFTCRLQGAFNAVIVNGTVTV